MSIAFGLYITDPNLLGCQLHRLGKEVQLSGAQEQPPLNAVGVGAWADDTVLIHRLPFNALPSQPSELGQLGKSQVMLFHARALPVGMSLEDNTQPFRFRHWLFAQVGELSAYRSFKQRLWDELPEHLKRHVRGETDGEVAFALFLKGLRDTGRTDDRALEPGQVLEVLGAAARHLERLSREAAPERPVNLTLFASNEDVLAAVRLGESPLYLKTLEGQPRCEVHRMQPSSPHDEPLLRAHERCRAVALATRVPDPAGWTLIEAGHGVAVGPDAVLARSAL